ncbi:MAG: glycosyl transferase [Clostridia bacterium]|nr:glycosyl transferase [Clostridia bacterium]
MNKFLKAIKLIGNPSKLVLRLSSCGFARLFSDEFFLKCEYKHSFGKNLNLDEPKTFNEKLQWLKLYNRKTEYTTMVDKYGVKKYVAELIGEEYVIPTLGVWERFEDIDFGSLPNQFVLKCTHDSGGLVICRDKVLLDIEKAKKRINWSLNRKYFYEHREWPYKNVKPRIIAEKYVEDRFHPEQISLLVYKIMCFEGTPKIIQTIQGDKTSSETIDYFDTEWNLLNMRQNYPNSEKPLERPISLERMLLLAAKMSVGHPFLRVDFYELEGKPYFSEFTFFSDAGLAKFTPESWDDTLGDWIKLPQKEK